MKRTFIIALFLCLSLGSISVAYAIVDETKTTDTAEKTTKTSEKTSTSGKTTKTTTSTNSSDAGKAEVNKTTAEARAADAIAKCDAIQTKISTTTTRYENNKKRNVIAYQNMADRIAKFVARFQAKGLDTATLTADLATLNIKVVKLNTDHAAYMTTLANTKNYVCGKSEGQFKTALEDARKLMQVVRLDIADIHSFYQVSIRADLVALKSQVEKTEDTSSSTGSSAKTSTTTTTVPTATSATKETQ